MTREFFEDHVEGDHRANNRTKLAEFAKERKGRVKAFFADSANTVPDEGYTLFSSENGFPLID